MQTPEAAPPPAPEPLPPAPPRRRRLVWRALAASVEGRLLFVGLSLVALISAGIGVGLMLAPAETLHYAAVIGLNIVIGRAAGMSYGFASGLGPVELVATNLLVEAAQVLVIYPLFVLAWNELIDTRRLQPALQRLRGAAESGRHHLRGWGIAGLFVFVFMPFWMTGPVVGAIVGYLLGLRTAVTLGVVLSATVVAVVLYARLFEQLDAWASAAHPYAVFALIVAVAALVALIRRRTVRGRAALLPPRPPAD